MSNESTSADARERSASRLSEARVSAILEAAIDSIITIDYEGRILDFNPAAERTFGFRREDVVGRPIGALLVPPELRAAHARGMARFLATGTSTVIGRRVELTALCADGSRLPVEISITVVEQDGRPPIFTAYVRDLSEQKRMEQQREQAESALHEALVAAERASGYKSRFLAEVSYELRTPMAAIVGYAELLARPNRTSAETDRWIRQLKRNADYMTSLVGDVLDIAQIESGGVRPELRDVELGALVEEVELLFRPMMTEKLLFFVVAFDTPVPAIWRTDPCKIKQILVNLIANAIKSTNKGRVELRISTENGDAAEGIGAPTLRFDVRDGSRGMSAAALAGLRDRFTRIARDGTTASSGAGLGLSISQHFACLLGGGLTVDSSKENGTHFAAAFPLAPADVDAMVDPEHVRASARAHDEASATEALPSTRVLAVDDSEDNRYILSLLLEDAGVDVTLATNGQEALDRIASDEAFDVVFMDMQMPVMDGYDAVRALRERGVMTPVIALTAYAMAEDERRCLEAGCDAFLTKPVNAKRIYGAVREWTDRGGAESTHTVDAIDTDDTDDAVDTAVTIDDDGAVLLSSLMSDEEYRPLLMDYVDSLRVVLKDLALARAGDDLDTIRTLAHRTKGTAANYGFPDITEIAKDVEVSIRRDEALDAAAFERLLSLLARAIRSVDEAPPTGN